MCTAGIPCAGMATTVLTPCINPALLAGCLVVAQLPSSSSFMSNHRRRQRWFANNDHSIVAFSSSSTTSLPSSPTTKSTTTTTTASASASTSTSSSPLDESSRPMTVWERIITFPRSVQALYRDWQQSRHIHDAAYNTPRNAWTQNATTTMPTTVKSSSSLSQTTTSTSTTATLIPWRQQEQYRRLRQSLSLVLPTVLLWLLPIVGYIPMLLAIAAPRLLLSRHFHNVHEIHYYNQLSYQQRYIHYSKIQQHFVTKHNDISSLFSIDSAFTTTATTTQDNDSNVKNNYHENNKNNNNDVNNNSQSPWVDAAGPVPRSDEIFHLYELLTNTASDHHDRNNPALLDQNGTKSHRHRTTTNYLQVDQFPSVPYLVDFALAVGVYQTLPPWWSIPLAQYISPQRYLRYLIRSIAITIAQDDQALLRMLVLDRRRRRLPNNDNNNNIVTTTTTTTTTEQYYWPDLLTDIEVMDACLLRGLPIVNVTYMEMRQCLANYLYMMDSYHQTVVHNNNSNNNEEQQQEAWGLLALHLVILRDSYDKGT